MTSRATKAEILAYRERTGASVTDLVDHFAPSLVGPDREREFERIKKMVQRGAGTTRQPQDRPNRDDDAGGPVAIAVETRHYDPGKLERIPFLEWQLASLVASYEAVLAAGVVGRVAALDSRISEVRQHLDAARGEAGRAVTLDRTPDAVAEEVERRAKRIRELAARARERDL